MHKKTRNISKSVLILSLLLAACNPSLARGRSPGKSKPSVAASRTVFRRWIHRQKKRKDVDLNETMKRVNARFARRFSRRVPRGILPQLSFVFPRTFVWKEMTSDERAATVKQIRTLRGFLENDIPGFVDYLLENNFAGQEVNNREERLLDRGNLSAVTRKYRRFLETLVYHPNSDRLDSIMNSLANRFLEYCFYPETHDHFFKLLSSKENYPVLRMLYEAIWYYLARAEWIHWHQNTLENLKREFDAGKEIVYIAGGSDIFQLIAHGIYNIRNIDPIYPTQTTYYSEGWDFLALGRKGSDGIGDTIVFNDKRTGGKNLVMRRISYEKHGTLLKNKRIYGKRVTIPRSTTVWSIENRKTKERLGTYTLERRFVDQDDFKTDGTTAHLISFNELYFILTTSSESWGINPRLFPKDFTINVKQTRAPLSHRVLMNMRKVQESTFPNRFGSSVIGD